MPEPTPNTPNSNEPHKSYDDLIAEVLKEHASPEKEEAALQERIERDAQVLRDFLNPTQEQQEQGNRYQSQAQQQQHEQQSQEPQPEPKSETVHRVSIEGRDYEVRVDAHDITNAAKLDQPRPANCAQRVRDAFGCSYFMDGKGGERSQRTPFLRCHWLSCFENYLAERWFDSDHPLPGYFQGPNAKNPALAPLVEIAKARGVFDLHDPLTATVWEDYLNEHPIRRQLWEKYERENGSTRALYWRNAQGEAWEAVHGADERTRIVKQ